MVGEGDRFAGLDAEAIVKTAFAAVDQAAADRGERVLAGFAASISP